jgi:hypothetical protein
VVLIRLLLFISFFYILYFILRKLVFTPFREGFQRKQESARKTSTGRDKEGEVSVDYDPDKQNSQSSSVGEYIDYEEVPDEEEKK